MVLRCFYGNDNFIYGPVQKNVVQLVKSAQVGNVLAEFIAVLPVGINVTYKGVAK